MTSSKFLPLLLILFPLLSYSAFVDAIRDRELETYISSNSTFFGFIVWGEKASLYTYEIQSPQQEGPTKGIVFSTDFTAIQRPNGLFFPSLLKTPSGNRNVSVLPYRTMQKISCNDYLRNKIEFYSNATFYQFWVNLWSSDCHSLANYLDTNRVARQSKLREVVGEMSKYANSYIEASREFMKFGVQTASISDSLLTQQFAERLSTSAISILQNATKAKSADITTAERAHAELTTETESFRSQIEYIHKIIDTNTDSIAKLEEDSTSNAHSKAHYDGNAENELIKAQELLNLLMVEIPNSEELKSLLTELVEKKDLDIFERTLISLLPA